jgi:hypothetical protein
MIMTGWATAWYTISTLSLSTREFLAIENCQRFLRVGILFDNKNADGLKTDYTSLSLSLSPNSRGCLLAYYNSSDIEYQIR